jgi:hypothetical protein
MLLVVALVCIATVGVIAILTRITRGLTVVVTNQSRVTLHEVALVYRGPAVELPDLEPGETHSLKIKPTGESGLQLRYESDGKLTASPANVYFEPGYSGVISFTINEDGSIETESDVSVY